MNDAPFTMNDATADAEATPAVAASSDGLPAGATWNDNGTVNLPLQVAATVPVSNNGVAGVEATTFLTMRRLSGDAMLQAMNAKGSGDQARIMLSFSIGMNGPRLTALLGAMDAKDLIRATEVIAVFTGNGQTTGQ